MKNQRRFTHILLVLALMALISTTATGQNVSSRKGVAAQSAQDGGFNVMGLLDSNLAGHRTGDSEQPQPQNLGSATFLFDFCNGAASQYCNGVYPQSGVIFGFNNDQTKLYGTNLTPIFSASCPTPGFEPRGEIRTPINSGGTVYQYDLTLRVETVLYEFNADSGSEDGYSPVGSLVWDNAGNLWGTTCWGGAHNNGTVFELTPTLSGPWNETTLYSFGSQLNDGQYPVSGLIMDSAGNLWGTTENGGQYGYGTLFEIQYPYTNPVTPTIVHSFGCNQLPCPQKAPLPDEGLYPVSGVVESLGNLYGTTQYGGSSGNNDFGYGTVWQYSAGTETAIYGFCGQSGCTDGQNPAAGLIANVVSNAVTLYGTAELGGQTGYGTVFVVEPNGNQLAQLNVVYTFDNTHGAYPVAGLVADSTFTNIFGTTAGGGNANCNFVQQDSYGPGCGVTFQLAGIQGSYPWTLNSYYAFCPNGSFCTGDGATPVAGLLRNSAGNLIYGTTQNGGSATAVTFGGGTLFHLGCSGFCASLQVLPGSLSWGQVAVGEAGPAQFVKVTNNSNQAVTISSIQITGEFQLAKSKKGACGSVLKAGATCMIGATFNPEQDGLLTGQITINDNADGSPQTVGLSGTGVD
jgi:uncharacterized repeat protein (TIGR03803 family)